MAALFTRAPDRPVCVARELSKKFEEFWRGSAAELSARAETHPPAVKSACSSAGLTPHSQSNA